MGSEVCPVAECGSVAASPTVQELISHLRFSFIAVEFQNAAKTLVEREDRMNEKYIELGKKADASEKEKNLLVRENLKLINELKKKQRELDAFRKENLEYEDQIKVLNFEKSRVSKNIALKDELKKKQSEIDALRKLNFEYEEKVAELRSYKKPSTDVLDRVTRLEKEVEEVKILVGRSFILENKQQKTSAAESSKPKEPKFQKIIKVEDEDLQQCIATLKRKRVSKEIKREYNSDFVDNIQIGTQPKVANPVSTPRPDGITQRKNIDERYKPIIIKMKMKNGRWERQVDMVQESKEKGQITRNHT